MTTSEEFDDPFLRHFQRDPLPDAGIRIILLTDLPPDRAEAVIAPLVECTRGHGAGGRRPASSRSRRRASAARSTSGLAGRDLPLVLVTTADEPWTEAHLEPLLEAIDHCDHVIGRRPAEGWERCRRWLATWPRRLVFAVPLRDVHSPCRLHRLEKLAAIPLQSASSFLDIEILAKATFFGHLIDEVDVPALSGRVESRGRWSDLRRLLRHPSFVQPSGPAEEAQGQDEGDDRPGGEDRPGRGRRRASRPPRA